MKHSNKPSLIILAGGQSKRFGSNKALFEVNGKKIIEFIIDEISPICKEVIISSNSDDFRFTKLRIIKDQYKNIGPIAGIYSGLIASKTEQNIMVSCDTPLISRRLCEYLLEVSEESSVSVTVPTYKTQIEPLIGVYNKTVSKELLKAIDLHQYAPIDIIQQIPDVKYVEINTSLPFYHPSLFQNLNRQDDIYRIVHFLNKRSKIQS